ncbi:hypothetical protein [Nocardia cyriacigeorgica]|uniref:ApeA N-terminal domain 1-containing protein n=1 Tax=Nocardia cyriacigeorgica TaxID=135487 RepID=UPI0024573FF2|nr:hypothetical protein [Nocardia cyriacigeorgica]
MTSSPLKLPFALDDYLVTWDLPTDTGETFLAHGALTLSSGQPPKGSAHGEFPHIAAQLKSGGAGFPQYVDVPQLVGRLSSGGHVLLVNARVTYWFDSQAMIDAAAALLTLADVTADEPVEFQGLEIQIGGLDAVAGVSPIKQTTFPRAGAGTWSAELSEERSQSWADDVAKLSLDFDGSFRTFDPFSFRMGFSPVIRVEFERGMLFGALLDDWVEPIRKVVSIATGRAEPLTCAVLKLSDIEGYDRSLQVFGSGITQAPYESRLDDVREVNSPLSLKTDEVSLLDIVRRWQSMSEKHHPLVETYGTMLHARDQHPRSRFLLLLQAIEGTHGYGTKSSFDRRTTKHQATRNDLIEAAAAVLDKSQLKFLERNLGKYPPAGLTAAMSEVPPG